MTELEKYQTGTVTTPEMEWVTCMLCGEDDPELLYTLQDYYTRQPGQFSLVRCQHCGLVYLNPRPTIRGINTYYPPTYGCYAPIRIEDLSRPRRWLLEYGFRKRCQPLLNKQSLGKALDVGCGPGHFLAAMRKYGHWETVGVDLSAQAITFAREVLGLAQVYAGRIEEMEFAKQTFDAVTMWDALEHLHDPRRVLLEMNRLLKPEGYLLLRVPAFDSLDARLFGPYWVGLDAPRHMVVFSRETLTRLLRETGFTIERLWCMSGSHGSFVLSLRFWLSQQQRDRWPGNWLLNIMGSPLVQVLSAPYFFIIDRFLLGPEMTVLARKREMHED